MKKQKRITKKTNPAGRGPRCFCAHFGVEGCRAEMVEYSREKLIYCPTSDIYVHPGSALGMWLMGRLRFIHEGHKGAEVKN